MLKTVLFLTDNVKPVARWLFPRAESYKQVGKSRAEGILKTGEPFLILQAMDPEHVREAVAGYEFGSYEVIGDVPLKSLEIAKTRVR